MTVLLTQLNVPRYRTAIPASVTARLSSTEITGLLVAFLVWLVIVVLAEPYGRPWGTGMEAFCYWASHLSAPYANSDWTKPGAYVYSPAFIQLVSPLTALPWAIRGSSVRQSAPACVAARTAPSRIPVSTTVTRSSS